MDRKKFFQGVRSFKDFRHSRVTNLSVDTELVTFVYSSSGIRIDVSIDLHESPKRTFVYYGDKEQTFENKYLLSIVNSILPRSFYISLSLILLLSFFVYNPFLFSFFAWITNRT